MGVRQSARDERGVGRIWNEPVYPILKEADRNPVIRHLGWAMSLNQYKHYPAIYWFKPQVFSRPLGLIPCGLGIIP